MVLRSVEGFSDGAIVSFYLSLLLGVVISAILMTVLHDRVGPGVLGIIGSLCLMYVCYAWLFLEQGTTLWSLGWQLVVLGTGGGLTTASGLVGAALGGPMPELPRTMTAVQFVRLLMFMMIAPLFVWMVTTRAFVHFTVLSWNVRVQNAAVMEKVNTIIRRFESHGLTPTAAKHKAMSLIANQLHLQAMIYTAHDLFAVAFWAGVILFVFSIAMAASGKGISLAQRPQVKESLKTERLLTSGRQTEL